MSAFSFRAILAAAFVAFGMLSAWSTIMIALFGAATLNVQRQRPFEMVYVRLDGEPVIMRYSQDGATQEILSLDRKPTDGSIYQMLQPNYTSPRPGGRFDVSSSLWTWRLAGVADGGSPANYWYLVHDGRVNGTAYGVGYHSATKRVIGYFGRSGFREQVPPAEDRFQVAGECALVSATPETVLREPYAQLGSALHLLADGKVWRVDTRRKTVRVLTAAPDAVSLGWAWRTDAELPAEGGPVAYASQVRPKMLAVRGPETLLLVDADPDRIEKYLIPADLRDKGLAVYQTHDGRLLLASRSDKTNRLVWMDQEGKILDEKTAVIDPPGAGFDENAVRAVSPLAGPGLLWQAILFGIVMQNPLSDSQEEMSGWTRALMLCVPGLILVTIVSVVAAWATYRRQRQFRLPGAAAWAAFVFLFGPFGWLAYRFGRDWPPTEDCPECSQPTPRDRERCCECDAAFPPPKLTGTEVFA